MRFLLLVLFAWSFQVAFAGEPLKLVSWNLEWFPGGSPGASTEAGATKMFAAQNALRAINPDILCLQEIRDWAAANELVSVLPGFHVAIASAFKGKQQQVIATRLPVDRLVTEAKGKSVFGSVRRCTNWLPWLLVANWLRKRWVFVVGRFWRTCCR